MNKIKRQIEVWLYINNIWLEIVDWAKIWIRPTVESKYDHTLWEQSLLHITYSIVRDSTSLMLSLFPPLHILPVKRHVCPRSCPQQQTMPIPILLIIRTDAPARIGRTFVFQLLLPSIPHQQLALFFICSNIIFPSLQSSTFIICIVSLLYEGMFPLPRGSCDKGWPSNSHCGAIEV